MMKRYGIFVSSTYKDLKKERDVVRKALLDMGHFPMGMEAFPAIDQEQFEYIKKTIDIADYYVLILGGHVGTIDPQTKKSYTQMEYEYACEKKIPIIVFVKLGKDGEPVVLEETVTKQRQYKKFLKLAQTGRIRKGFKKKEELSGLIIQSLAEEICVHPRSGWKRDYKIPSVSDKRLLMRGRLLFNLVIGKSIYRFNGRNKEIEIPEFGISYKITYGKGTQGTFRLIIDTGKCAKDFYQEVPKDFFDEDELLAKGYKMQISLATLGNMDDVLLFFSVGDLMCTLVTRIYRITDVGIIFLKEIYGQSFMYLDYGIDVPYGSQGLYESYAYYEGDIVHVDDATTVSFG
ncbi:DUF4062 domain-containing protein [Butyrivibrio sp. AE3006]|uniref:DUF4062 domain-containing protein n=1 Tax=Butyrivibrio sp. AE3006 TaxID=1280673 RepID=UPI00041C708A|nr:DUF4062 domain-containing protein [Butyrivibrio sp. AE3006]